MIAWIGADPNLRTVAASHRRGTGLPLPSHTRAAKVAVAACFVLTGGAVLGITAAVNDGLLAPLASNPSPVVTQDNAGAPSQIPARPPAAGIRPDPTVLPAPAPITTQSMVANHQAPQPLPAPPAAAQSDHVAAPDPGGSPVAHVGSSVAAPATHPAPPHRADPGHPDRPTAPIKPADAGKPATAVTLAGSAHSGDSADPTDQAKLTSSEVSAGTGNPVANPTGTGNSMDPNDPAGTVGWGDTGKPAASLAARGGDRTPNGVTTRGVDQSPSTPRSSTFSQRSSPDHGPISAGDPTGSTSGQGSTKRQGTRGFGVWMFGIAVGLLVDNLPHQ